MIDINLPNVKVLINSFTPVSRLKLISFIFFLSIVHAILRILMYVILILCGIMCNHFDICTVVIQKYVPKMADAKYS